MTESRLRGQDAQTMGDFAARAARLLERVAQLRARAGEVSDEELKTVLSSVADTFEDIADRLLKENLLSTTIGAPRPKTVLVIEDESMIALMIEEALEAEGLRCACMTNITRARLLSQRHRFEAAVLDISVGEEIAFPLARDLSEAGVPCIFISGYEPDVIPEEFGDVPFFQKPFEAEALVSAVLKCVKKGARTASG